MLAFYIGWYTFSLDFSSAFVQADIDVPIWVHIPRGFRYTLPGRICLRLKRSVYGIAQAPRLWHKYLFTALKSLGFIQNPIDPCLLMRSDCIIVVYVDDCGCAVKNKTVADKLISDLRQKGFALTIEGSFIKFLGIKFEKFGRTNIRMTQDP